MIKVGRGAEPKTLRRNGLRWRADLLRLQADPQATPVQIRKAEGKYNHPEVKAALRAMFAEKCAYCEHAISVGYYGDIEHFRPKALFPDLTFSWTNLLFSCAICNNAAHKADYFPLAADGSPLLIDPTDPADDPADHLIFRYDPVTSYALVYGTDARGVVVEQVFDLNGTRGRKELLQHRSRHIKRLWAIAVYALDGDAAAIALLREASAAHEEYAAFARALCQQFGIAL